MEGNTHKTNYEKYLFSDISATLGDPFYLKHPNVTSRCMEHEGNGITVQYITQNIWKGEPVYVQQMNYQTHDILKDEEVPPEAQTETWCMFLNTWNASWTAIIQREPIICWEEEI
jgi:hypothetical protein